MLIDLLISDRASDLDIGAQSPAHQPKHKGARPGLLKWLREPYDGMPQDEMPAGLTQSVRLSRDSSAYALCEWIDS